MRFFTHKRLNMLNIAKSNFNTDFRIEIKYSYQFRSIKKHKTLWEIIYQN